MIRRGEAGKSYYEHYRCLSSPFFLITATNILVKFFGKIGYPFCLMKGGAERGALVAPGPIFSLRKTPIIIKRRFLLNRQGTGGSRIHNDFPDYQGKDKGNEKSGGRKMHPSSSNKSKVQSLIYSEYSKLCVPCCDIIVKHLNLDMYIDMLAQLTMQLVCKAYDNYCNAVTCPIVNSSYVKLLSMQIRYKPFKNKVIPEYIFSTLKLYVDIGQEREGKDRGDKGNSPDFGLGSGPLAGKTNVTGFIRHGPEYGCKLKKPKVVILRDGHTDKGGQDMKRACAPQINGCDVRYFFAINKSTRAAGTRKKGKKGPPRENGTFTGQVTKSMRVRGQNKFCLARTGNVLLRTPGQATKEGPGVEAADHCHFIRWLEIPKKGWGGFPRNYLQERKDCRSHKVKWGQAQEEAPFIPRERGELAHIVQTYNVYKKTPVEGRSLLLYRVTMHKDTTSGGPTPGPG